MRRSAGYSLFEVMIAFAILSLVLSILVPGQTKLLSRATQVDQQLLALDFAYSRLDKLRVIAPLSLGQTTYEYRDWRIHQTVSRSLDLTDATASVVFVKLDIMSKSGKSIAEIQTYMSLR